MKVTINLIASNTSTMGLKPRAEATEARQGPTYMVSGPNRMGDKIRS